VGASGAGKSTAVDLILGLLLPTGGSLLMNGEVLNRDVARSWQLAIGYVPQAPFMADDSLRANVACGVSAGEIDDAWVMQCLEMAHLDEWFAGLEQGLDIALGDRGTMLFGGQRQRVAIARALYNRPSLLVLDEATSALASESEQAVHAPLSSLCMVRSLPLQLPTDSARSGLVIRFFFSIRGGPTPKARMQS